MVCWFEAAVTAKLPNRTTHHAAAMKPRRFEYMTLSFPDVPFVVLCRSCAPHDSVHGHEAPVILMGKMPMLRARLFPSGSAHYLSRLGAGVLAVLEDLGSVDEYMDHAGGVLTRLLVRRMVADGGRVEDDDVGTVSFLQFSAPVELEVLRRQRRSDAGSPLPAG